MQALVCDSPSTVTGRLDGLQGASGLRGLASGGSRLRPPEVDRLRPGYGESAEARRAKAEASGLPDNHQGSHAATRRSNAQCFPKGLDQRTNIVGRVVDVGRDAHGVAAQRHADLPGGQARLQAVEIDVGRQPQPEQVRTPPVSLFHLHAQIAQIGQ